mmetsp:Transcript_60951/g.70792  ORF Transcript_60951/g.70792 Transcript_60951/m.70792 type:complete len:94 (+) Transcript_60951:975-1256(+)
MGEAALSSSADGEETEVASRREASSFHHHLHSSRCVDLEEVTEMVKTTSWGVIVIIIMQKKMQIQLEASFDSKVACLALKTSLKCGICRERDL